jgi:hypothetical protein
MSFWKTLLIVICVLAFAGCNGSMKQSTDSITEFWQWFKAHENSLAEQHGPYDSEFQQLTSKLKSIDERLAYEIAPGKKDKKEFVISADANREVFPLVRKVAAAAPPLSRWQVVSFRPRAATEELMEMAIPAAARYPELRADEMRFSLNKDGEVADLIMYLKDYNGDKEEQYNAKIMLQEAVGEYDSVMRIGDIECRPLNEANAQNSKPLSKLAADLDQVLR